MTPIGKPLQNVNFNSSGIGLPPGRTIPTNQARQTSSSTSAGRLSNVPPLPKRPPHLNNSISNRPSFRNSAWAPSMYGGYTGSYGGYGGYPSHGGYHGSVYSGGLGYGSYGYPNNMLENRFLQVAEESSRDAFQSIESLVRAFTSVSMMLESTYHAMYTSFRAVLGVVDNFSRLRQVFAQFLSAITILRIIKNFYHRLLYWIGVLDHNPQTEQVWNSVTNKDAAQVARYSKWPLFTFIAFLFGGPYLISKLFSSNSPDSNQWDLKKGKFIRVPYPHRAGSDAEISFQANDVLNIAPMEMQTYESTGWFLAADHSGKVGYVPVTRAFETLPKQNNAERSLPSDIASGEQAES